MSDDDWGDDAPAADEWDDDEAPKKKSSGMASTGDEEDEGWGDESSRTSGGGGGEEWGDAAFEDEGMNDASSSSSSSSAPAGLSLDIQIANIFYEAEDIQREEPQQALLKFQQVIELARSSSAAASPSPAASAATSTQPLVLSHLSDELRTAVFSSLVHIVILLYKTGGGLEAMLASYRQLLSLSASVTRNEAQEAIDSILATVSYSTNFDLLVQIYEVTMNSLLALPDTDKMIFHLRMKLCRAYIERAELQKASELLEALHATCRLPDGEDDKRNKGSELLEIYALKIKISSFTGNTLALKALYNATHDLSIGVKDPRSLSVIKQCWGLMFGSEDLWARAYGEFYAAFTLFQEMGDRDQAKRCLLYVVIANMLSGGQQNPFDAREAKVYQNEGDVMNIVQLRNAYEKCQVNEFNRYLHEITRNLTPSSSLTNRSSDQNADSEHVRFLQLHLSTIVRDFHSRVICALTKSYRRIKLSSLADILKVEQPQIELLCASLILDGELNGKMDAIVGILDLTTETTADQRRDQVIEDWCRTLQTLQSHITVK